MRIGVHLSVFYDLLSLHLASAANTLSIANRFIFYLVSWCTSINCGQRYLFFSFCSHDCELFAAYFQIQSNQAGSERWFSGIGLRSGQRAKHLRIVHYFSNFRRFKFTFYQSLSVRDKYIEEMLRETSILKLIIFSTCIWLLLGRMFN